MVTAEVVTLHGAGEALADGHARDVDQLAGGKHGNRKLAAKLEVGAFGAHQAKLVQRLARH